MRKEILVSSEFYIIIETKAYFFKASGGDILPCGFGVILLKRMSVMSIMIVMTIIMCNEYNRIILLFYSISCTCSCVQSIKIQFASDLTFLFKSN